LQELKNVCKVCEKVGPEFRRLKSKPSLLFVKRDTPPDDIEAVELDKLINDKRLRANLRRHFELDLIALPTPLAHISEMPMVHRVDLA